MAFIGGLFLIGSLALAGLVAVLLVPFLLVAGLARAVLAVALFPLRLVAGVFGAVAAVLRASALLLVALVGLVAAAVAGVLFAALIPLAPFVIAIALIGWLLRSRNQQGTTARA